MDIQTRIANLVWGLVMNVCFNAFCSVRLMRQNIDRLLGSTVDELKAQYGYLKVGSETVGGFPMEWVSATAGPPRVVLYLHGGGYFMGGIESYRRFAFRMAHRLDSLVYLPEYRLAPESPFPAALEDAIAAYRRISEKHPDVPIFVGGDSAGGGLCLALLLALRDQGQALPKGCFVLSPWADLTGEAESHRTNRYRDLWLSRRRLRKWSRYYAGQQDRKSPYLSPVFGDYNDLPPLLILAGEQEILLDDARAVAEKARQGKVKVELQVWPGMQHAWPLGIPQLSESKEAMKTIASFLTRNN
jgi:epsilon-lactone hydrolase